MDPYKKYKTHKKKKQKRHRKFIFCPGFLDKPGMTEIECEDSVNPIAFFAFLTSISPFINILGDDIGFEEKTRMPYMLCWGGSPRYQRAKNRCNI